MKTKRLTIVVAIALAAILLNNCTEKNYTINQLPTDSVHIHGTVYAWRCGIGDIFNNPHDPDLRRISTTEGETAFITFIRDNGFTTVIETDDTADFDLYLSAGAFNVVVSSGFNYPPDTFYNIHLRPGDTALSFDVYKDVLDPAHVYCSFLYPRIFDTMSTQEEWKVISDLNELSYYKGGIPALDLSDISNPADLRRVRVSPVTGGETRTEYRVPVLRERYGRSPIYHVVEARDLLQSIIDADTTGLVPDNFDLSIADTHICLM